MTKYFVLTNRQIGSNYNWSSVANWASTSGGSDAVGPPTKNDDIIFDANSFDHTNPANNQVVIDGTSSSPSVCRNLTINTGFAFSLKYNSTSRWLVIYGVLNIQGTASGIISINPGNTNFSQFMLLGSCGLIQGVTAKNLESVGGVRIYFDNLFSNNTVTTCPFWLYPNPPQWVTGKNYVTGDYVSNSTYGHLYVCVADHISNSFGVDQLTYWQVADPSGDPKYLIPNRITVRVTNDTELLSMGNAPDYNYVLYNDIDLTGVTWTPIGTYDSPFTGSFNGQNNVIKNLTYDDGSNDNYAGLFGSVGSGSLALIPSLYSAFISPVIKNITLDTFVLHGEYAQGSLIGFCQTAQVTNCHARNITITGNGSFSNGGLIGELHGYDVLPTLVENCSVNNVSISGSNIQYTGGFIGATYPGGNGTNASIILNILISNCYATGVTIAGVDSSNCSNVGGFIGFCEGTLEECYCSGTITGINNAAGGLVGSIDFTTVKDCYAHVNVSGDSASSSLIGGFVGYIVNMVVSITNCYCSGTVTGQVGSTGFGGFIGEVYFRNNADVFSILNSYSVGLVTNTDGSGETGGFIGFIRWAGVTTQTFSISNCAWYTGEYAHAIGTNNIRSTTNESLTTAGYGTDETDNTHFYTKTHPVYASGLTPIYQTYLKDEAGNVLLDEHGNPLLQE